MYGQKGTQLGIEGYAESLTGFVPVTTLSSNLMLSVQDSTFYKSTGRWSTEDAVLTATDEMVPPNSDKSIDLVYTLKIDPTATGSMSLGLDNPVVEAVPITPNTEYFYSAQVKCPATGGFTFTIEYYDKDGNLVSSTPEVLGADNSWQMVGISETSPPNASYVVLYGAWDTVTPYYVDMVYVGRTPFVEYEEARAFTLTLLPKLENYVQNPSFEVDTTGWTLTGVSFTRSSDVPKEGYSGSFSGKFEATGPWSLQCESNLELETGIYFNVSQYMKSYDLTSVTAVIDLYDSGDNLIDTITEEHAVTFNWTRDHITTLIGSDSTAKYAKYRLEGDAGTLYLDMVMAADTYAPSDYFDGSMPESYGAIWESTPHASNSLLYPTKATKFLRLAQTLVNWAPMNSWWRLATPAGLEYTNLDV